MVGTILQQKIEDWIVRRLKSPNKSFQIAGHIFDVSIHNIIWNVRTDLHTEGELSEGVFIVDSPYDLIGIARWVCRKLFIHDIVADIQKESIGKM